MLRCRVDTNNKDWKKLDLDKNCVVYVHFDEEFTTDEFYRRCPKLDASNEQKFRISMNELSTAGVAQLIQVVSAITCRIQIEIYISIFKGAESHKKELIQGLNNTNVVSFKCGRDNHYFADYKNTIDQICEQNRSRLAGLPEFLKNNKMLVLAAIEQRFAVLNPWSTMKIMYIATAEPGIRITTDCYFDANYNVRKADFFFKESECSDINRLRNALEMATQDAFEFYQQNPLYLLSNIKQVEAEIYKIFRAAGILINDLSYCAKPGILPGIKIDTKHGICILHEKDCHSVESLRDGLMREIAKIRLANPDLATPEILPQANQPNLMYGFIRVYQENNVINIQFDKLLFGSMKQAEISIQEYLLRDFPDYDRDKIWENFKRLILSHDSVKVSVQLNNQELNGFFTSSTYTLPHDANMMMDFLAKMGEHYAASEFTQIEFINHSIVDKMNFEFIQTRGFDFSTHPYANNVFFGPGKLTVPLQDLLTDHPLDLRHCTPEKKALEIILEMTDLPEYTAIHDPLRTIYDWHKSHSAMRFYDCLNRLKREMIIAGNTVPDYTSKLAFAAKLFTESKREVLFRILKTINHQVKMNIYTPCLGLPAHEQNNYYSCNFTEFTLLKHAHFNIRSDGRLSMSVKDNAGYAQCYAKKEPSEPRLESEMRYLGQIIGLEFADDADFQNEIIFSPDCSRRLIQAGIHIDAEYVARLLKDTNSVGFFSSNNGDSTAKQESALNVLMPILDKAYAEMFPEIENRNAFKPGQVA